MQKELELFQTLVTKLLAKEIEEPVVAPIAPDTLFESLDISLTEKPISEDSFQEILEKLILNTPRTASRLFFNQLFGGRNPKATLGDLLSVILNNSMYTYKVAGPMVGIEKEILHQISKLIGYGKTSDGTIAQGGSMTNLMAMLMARDAYNPKIRKEGVTQQLIIYTSAESHYSIPKNAAFMGIGRNQVRYIETNEKGEMLPKKLANQIEKDKKAGLHPFFVNATAGTTVLGAFDEIEPIHKICKEHKLWLHVDGAYCGGVLFSKKYKYLIKGIELTDSFSFNAHKMLGTPLSCSILVTQHKKYLNNSFSNDAAYLYQTDGDDYNLGKTSLQCGRRNDALKLWTLWKSVGTSGLEKIVDKQFALAETARNYIKNNPDYQLYSFDDSISVCFNYKNIPAEVLCTELYHQGKLMVGYGTFNNVQFIRLVTINAGNNDEEIREFFKVIEAFVKNHSTFKKQELYQQ